MGGRREKGKERGRKAEWGDRRMGGREKGEGRKEGEIMKMALGGDGRTFTQQRERAALTIYTVVHKSATEGYSVFNNAMKGYQISPRVQESVVRGTSIKTTLDHSGKTQTERSNRDIQAVNRKGKYRLQQSSSSG